MNFRRGPLAAKNRIVEYRSGLIKTAAIAAGVILFWIGSALIETHMTQKKVDLIDSQITSIFKNTFPSVTHIVEPVHQMRTRVEALKKEAFSSGENTPTVRSVDLLRDISRIIPESTDLRFSKLNISESGIYIDAVTTSFNLVDEIKSKIESLKSVSSVTTPTTKREDDGIHFNLRIETNPEEIS